MTPRGTDWSLAGLVALGLASGLLTWLAGAWPVAVHDLAGLALAAVAIVKMRRVRRPRGLGGVALAAVAAVVLSGLIWATAGPSSLAGYTILVWHGFLGAALGLGMLAHARVRAKPPRARDVLDRRQLLSGAAIG